MPCPICDAPTSETFRPFCSNRCAEIDLGRWMLGHYKIPTPLTGEEDDAVAQKDASDT
ncbi:MAG: DNA gyrase inhibitor YacG [Pseudomonadota bacterium]